MSDAKIDAAVKPKRPRAVVYPVSDGKPMAETDLHYDLSVYTRNALKRHFRPDPYVYVGANNFLLWKEGDAGVRVSPDVYVVFGVPSRLRDNYLVWEEGGRTPDVVFEFTSKTTRAEDEGKKFRIYEQDLRVPEYFLFDPRADYVKPRRLRGFRLDGSEYVPLEMVDGRLHSERLGLDIVQFGETLRLWDPEAGQWLESDDELADRAKRETRRALDESIRAEAEARRADAEAKARLEAEAELAKLRAELALARSQSA